MVVKIIYWLPRILAILFIIFISLFALDVFSQPNWFGALMIHLIPSLVLTGLTIVSWRHSRLGGFLFLAAALVMIWLTRLALILVVPTLVIGALFLVQSYWPKTQKGL